MHAVAQTHAFTRAAEDAGMTEEEISELVVGTGGCRK
jgi:hypothetical protein